MDSIKKKSCLSVRDKDGRTIANVCVVKKEDTGKYGITLTDENKRSRWFDRTDKLLEYINRYDMPQGEREAIVELINEHFRMAKFEEDRLKAGYRNVGIDKFKKRKM